MNKNIVIFFLLLSFTKGFSQKDSIRKNTLDNFHFFPSIGASYQKEVVGEVGFFYGKYISGGMCNPGVLYGYKLATEFNFDNKNFYMAPKISMEFDVLILSIRLNVIDYTNATFHDLKFTPEIGLTLGGLGSLHYGYNIPLTASNIKDIGTHRITLTYNFGVLKLIN